MQPLQLGCFIEVCFLCGRYVIMTDTISRIHMLGAPGAGVTTLGRSLAECLNIRHFDTDDFHWFTEDALPYRRRRNPEHRRKLLTESLDAQDSWVLSGSLCGWGDVFVPRFQVIVYCWLPVETRLMRIRERELARYGPDRLASGGDLHAVFEKFCTWASDYDKDSGNIRSRAHELEWLQNLPCPVLRLEEEMPLEESVAIIVAFLAINDTSLHK